MQDVSEQPVGEEDWSYDYDRNHEEKKKCRHLTLSVQFSPVLFD